MMNKKLNKGFTLIELLVVIAIIGILAAVVLASLNTARSKGRAAAIKADLANSRAQASLYYNDYPLSYVNVCNANVGATKGIKTFWDDAIAKGGTGALCNSDTAGWALASPLATTPATYWCVDDKGASRSTTSGGAAYTEVSGSATAALLTSTSTTCN